MKGFIATGLVLLLGASPVWGQGTGEDVRRMVSVLNAVGVVVYYDSKECKKYDAYGMYLPTDRSLHVCNRGDRSEQLDTLRHEAWHVAQDYADCKLGNNGFSPLARHTEIGKEYWDQTLSYPQGRRHMEADAYQAAHRLSTRQIADLLGMKYRACNR